MPNHSLSRLRSDLIWSFQVLIILTSIFTALTLLQVGGLVGDVLSHFPVQYAAVGFIGLLLFLRLRKPAFVVLAFSLCVANLIRISPYYSVLQDNDTTVTGTKVLVANVHTSNSNYQEFVLQVRKLKPIIAVILEVNQDWLRGLSPLVDLYPYRIEVPRGDNFGMVLFSSIPVFNVQSEPLGKRQPPCIKADIKIGDKTVTVLGVHPVPPVPPNGYQLRNEQLDNLAVLIRKNKTPAVILGDLNTTMWSSSFRKLVTMAKLEDPRKRFGILPTWPRQIPFLYIPVDHILVSPGVAVTNLETLAIDGSDHRGLIANLRFEAAEPVAQ